MYRSPEEAPLNVLAVAYQTDFNRKTLKKYGLDVELQPRQNNRPGTARRRRERSLNDLKQTHCGIGITRIATLRTGCEGLVAGICITEGNAQGLGIDPVELWKPLPMPIVPSHTLVGSESAV